LSDEALEVALIELTEEREKQEEKESKQDESKKMAHKSKQMAHEKEMKQLDIQLEAARRRRGQNQAPVGWSVRERVRVCDRTLNRRIGQQDQDCRMAVQL
jgi:hypothetical protein